MGFPTPVALIPAAAPKVIRKLNLESGSVLACLCVQALSLLSTCPLHVTETSASSRSFSPNKTLYVTISTRYKYEGCIDYSPCLQYAAVEMLCCNKKRFDVDEDEVIIREASGRRVYS